MSNQYPKKSSNFQSNLSQPLKPIIDSKIKESNNSFKEDQTMSLGFNRSGLLNSEMLKTSDQLKNDNRAKNMYLDSNGSRISSILEMPRLTGEREQSLYTNICEGYADLFIKEMSSFDSIGSEYSRFIKNLVGSYLDKNIAGFLCELSSKSSQSIIQRISNKNGNGSEIKSSNRLKDRVLKKSISEQILKEISSRIDSSKKTPSDLDTHTKKMSGSQHGNKQLLLISNQNEMNSADTILRMEMADQFMRSIICKMFSSGKSSPSSTMLNKLGNEYIENLKGSFMGKLSLQDENIMKLEFFVKKCMNSWVSNAMADIKSEDNFANRKKGWREEISQITMSNQMLSRSYNGKRRDSTQSQQLFKKSEMLNVNRRGNKLHENKKMKSREFKERSSEGMRIISQSARLQQDSRTKNISGMLEGNFKHKNPSNQEIEQLRFENSSELMIGKMEPAISSTYKEEDCRIKFSTDIRESNFFSKNANSSKQMNSHRNYIDHKRISDHPSPESYLLNESDNVMNQSL